MANRFIHTIFVTTICAGLFFMYGCSSSTWKDAQQDNTYEAYQAYIEDNPEGAHLAEANQRADSLYWNSIKSDSTAQPFETYLDEFPNGRFRSEARTKLNQSSPNGSGTRRAQVTGSNVIIRSDHTTESPSAGVVAKEGTIVQILGQYYSGNSSEAILKQGVTVVNNGKTITLPEGKALRVLADRNDSVRVSFTTPTYGASEGTISKENIEAIGGEKWYKIQTKDNITGWIYGKFIEEL